MDAIGTVTAFIDHLNAMELDAASALLDEAVVYHNMPVDPVTGPAAVKGVFAMIPMVGMAWETHAIVSDGNRVLTERTDRFALVDGRTVGLRVMGVFEVMEGKITAWRDYFDVAQWMDQMASAP